MTLRYDLFPPAQIETPWGRVMSVDDPQLAVRLWAWFHYEQRHTYTLHPAPTISGWGGSCECGDTFPLSSIIDKTGGHLVIHFA